jgi:S1-C subfamily serine protease
MRRSPPPERTPGAAALAVRRGIGTGPAARWSLLLALLCGGGLVAALAAGRAAPPPAVRALAQRVADGAAVHAWLGVMTQDLTDSVAESLGLASAEGALIAAVMAGSPAHLAGLKPGDVISAIDDVPVRSTADLSRLIGWAAPGDTLRLSIWRERSTRVVLVRIGVGPRTVGLDRAVPHPPNPPH